jgi:NADPH:quinone reductase-like Zn-dependent oxidoreductase
MKAVRFHEFGGPEVLRYEDVEVPTPGAGQVRIRVAATSSEPTHFLPQFQGDPDDPGRRPVPFADSDERR